MLWPDLTFLFETLYLCYLPSTTFSWFIVSQAESHLRTFIEYLLNNFFALPDPFSTPRVQNKGSSALHFSLHWLSRRYCKCSHGFNFHIYVWIPHPTHISTELQIAFHASSPHLRLDGHQVLWHSRVEFPCSAQQGCFSSGVPSPQAWHPTLSP